MGTALDHEGLEPGAQLALHAIRRAASGPGAGCPVSTDRVETAREAMRALAAEFQREGRKLRLGGLGALDPTPDERTLLNALSAGQRKDDASMLAALRWIAGFEPTEAMAQVAREAAQAFADASWTWGAPGAPRPPEPPFGMRPVRAVG